MNAKVIKVNEESIEFDNGIILSSEHEEEIDNINSNIDYLLKTKLLLENELLQ